MFAPEQPPTSLLPLDLGATSLPEPSLVSPSGTTITGEEEPSKRSSTLKREEDTIVSQTLTLTCLEQLKAINRVRIGEENEVTNLIEYLTNSTVRE